MRRPDVYGTGEAAALLGMHRNSIHYLIRQGVLRAKPVDGRHTITRAALVSFLLGRGCELSTVRRLFHSAESVALVRTPAAVQAAVGKVLPTVQCDGLFDLGRLIEGGKVWAAVLDLDELGTAHTARELRRFHEQPVRPELVALVGEEGVRSLPSPIPFDVPIGAGTTPGAIAGTLLRLRAAVAGRR
jgi:hypothetical protein